MAYSHIVVKTFGVRSESTITQLIIQVRNSMFHLNNGPSMQSEFIRGLQEAITTLKGRAGERKKGGERNFMPFLLANRGDIFTKVQLTAMHRKGHRFLRWQTMQCANKSDC